MVPEVEKLTPEPLLSKGPFGLLGDGMRAFAKVKGLKGLAIKGFMINSLLFFGLAALAYWGVEAYLVPTIEATVASWGDGEGFLAQFLGWVAEIVNWALRILVLVAGILVALLLSLTMMTFWYEAMSRSIMHHFRPKVPAPAFGFGRWVASLAEGTLSGLGLVILSLMALVLGVVPFIGPFLALGVNAYLIGREIREPYLVVRSETGESLRSLAKGKRGWTLMLGLLPVGVAMVPVLGWLLLPMVIMMLSAGVAWANESAQPQNKTGAEGTHPPTPQALPQAASETQPE